MRGMLLLVLIAFAPLAAAKRPEAVPIPDVLVMEITVRTLSSVPGGPPLSNADVETRAGAVRSFLMSMGGDAWYGGYLQKFGPPALEEEYKVATLLGLSETQLGLYYVRTQVTPRAETGAVVCKSPNPTTAAFCGLAVWNSARILNDREALVKFASFAERFRRAQKNGQWQWSEDLPSRSLKAPWISGLTQSLGISIMLRAFQFTNDTAYFKSARDALRWLKLPVSRGGLASRLDQGVWYEEYPDRNSPSHVLNGHMWALFGIWDYYRVTGDKEAKRMFDEGISALEAKLPQYDLDGWSVYSKENRKDFVSGAYQQFIIEQLRVLENITRSEVLARYRALWECSFQHDALFVHEVSAQFNRANGLPPPKAGYPRYCGKLIAR